MMTEFTFVIIIPLYYCLSADASDLKTCLITRFWPIDQFNTNANHSLHFNQPPLKGYCVPAPYPCWQMAYMWIMGWVLSIFIHLDERDERRNDQSDAAGQKSWELITQRLACSGGHTYKHIPVTCERAHTHTHTSENNNTALAFRELLPFSP